MNYIKISSALTICIFAIAVFIGCTRDDICPETTQSTPRLVMEFRDNTDFRLVKPVTNLSVKLTSTQEEVFTPRTDTIFQIPLDPSATSLQFSFTRDASGTSPNTDFATINYTRGEDVYINRACSFVTTYDDVSITIQGEGTANWMFGPVITNPTVENEDVTHITIFH